MATLRHIGELGNRPPTHRIAEVEFRSGEVSLAGALLHLAFGQSLEIEEAGLCDLKRTSLLQALGTALQNHGRLAGEGPTVVRGLHLDVIEGALKRDVDPIYGIPALRDIVYSRISEQEFVARSGLVEAHLTVDEGHIDSHRTGIDYQY